jgi:hypothetical protein
MLAHGFTVEHMVELVRAGLATATAERLVAGSRRQGCAGADHGRRAAGAGGLEHVNERPKLPQARMYLQSAQWGFDGLLTKRLSGDAFCFYLIGILASLRAVQHALINHDSTLSDEHRRVVEDWWQATPLSTPELHFIRTSRDQILKGGSFHGYAIATESSTGEEPNLEITGTSYELAYYDEAGKRHDLEEEIRRAVDWCDRELTAIEAKLPSA